MVQFAEQGAGSSFWMTRKFFTTLASKDKRARIKSEVRKRAPRLARSGKACGLPTKREDIEISAECSGNPKEADIAPLGRNVASDDGSHILSKKDRSVCNQVNACSSIGFCT